MLATDCCGGCQRVMLDQGPRITVCFLSLLTTTGPSPAQALHLPLQRVLLSKAEARSSALCSHTPSATPGFFLRKSPTMEVGPSNAQATLAHYWDDATDTLTGDQNTPITSAEGRSEASMLPTLMYGAVATVVFFWLGHWINAWRRARREKAFNL
jgi:hypothetical protein